MFNFYSTKSESPRIRSEFVIILALIIAVLFIYYQTKNFDFVLLDDDVYILNNPYVSGGLTSENVKWAFTRSHGGFWIPLTWLSYMVDSQLHGLNAGYYHVTNLILHISNTLLLFAVFRQMTGDLWRSAFTAVLFAVHPVHVESVAWVSERKDLLFALFWILTMWAYGRYANKPRPLNYGLVLLFFVAGLMSKPMIITLPFLLLLLDYWPLRRIQLKMSRPFGEIRASVTLLQIVAEKVPLILLSIGASVLTFVLQAAHGAVSSVEGASIVQRILQVPVTYVKYMVNMIWPQGLAAVYPYSPRIPVWQIAGSCLLLGLFSVVVIREMKIRPYLAVGWFWFLGTLVPVIGLIKIGSHAMADRYAYMTFVGLYIILAWGGADLLGRFRRKQFVLTSVAIALTIALMLVANYQTRHWANSSRLFSHAIHVNPDNFLAHRNLGLVLSYRGELDGAIGHFKEALRINPASARCYNDIGTVLMVSGRHAESIGYFEKALEYRPNYAKAHNNLGLVLMRQKKYGEAAIHFQAALKAKPGFKLARKNLEKVNTALARN